MTPTIWMNGWQRGAAVPRVMHPIRQSSDQLAVGRLANQYHVKVTSPQRQI
jgi:hypothetical protein